MPVGIYTLPAQTKSVFKTIQDAWEGDDIRLGTLVGPSLRAIGDEDGVGEGRGDEGEEEGNGAHVVRESEY